MYFVRTLRIPIPCSERPLRPGHGWRACGLRLRFRDGEMLEGLMPNDLTQVRAEGFFLNPPDTRGNVQRIFVPRSALSELTVLAVIGSAAKRRRQADRAHQTPLCLRTSRRVGSAGPPFAESEFDNLVASSSVQGAAPVG